MKGISVIICCYNSEARIAETLLHLARQKDVPCPWEILLVDNASTDNTSVFSQKLFEQYELENARVVYEPTAGLMHARNRGIAASVFDIIVFCDDDNHLNHDYIAIAWQIMRRQPEVGILGGIIEPKLPFYPGRWIEPNYTALAIGSQGDSEKTTTWVFGAGMILRRSVFDEIERRGVSVMLTGRLRAKQTSGEDAEICAIARHLGFVVFYSPRLVLGHKIAPNRLTRTSFIKANFMNVYPMIYLSLLNLMIQKKARPSTFYALAFKTALKNLGYFSWRSIAGRHNFFSFMMSFQNFQILLWLITKRKKFFNTFYLIQSNLTK